MLRERITAIPNVLTQPAPQIEILNVNDSGVELAVRPYCKPEHYGGVYFATNAAILEVLVTTGAVVPAAS